MALALPELPEEIQRKIVVSLPPKAFARSSVLSKSWLSFYNSTRCSFDFNFRYHPGSVQEIMNFDKSFSARLLREKLSVEEFKINIHYYVHNVNIRRSYAHELPHLVYKWLAALFTANIVKVLRMVIQTSPGFGKFYMPPEIFSNESLQALHLHLAGANDKSNCILDRVHSINLGCLRVLSLYFIDDKSTNKLLTACPTACPILEELTLSPSLTDQSIIIKGLHKLKNLRLTHFADVRIQEARKLKDIFIDGYADLRIEEAPALENVILIAYDHDDRTIINFQVCRRIKDLSMHVNSERRATDIQQIVSCLPELENVSLFMNCATDITISSRCLKSLELFDYEDQDLKIVKINAPNLRCYEYGCNYRIFSRQLMMKTGILEMVVINLMDIEIDQPYVPELRKALRMIEQLELGVDTVELDNGEHVCIKASRLNEKLNVSATRVIEMLDAGAVKYDIDGKLCF